MSGILGSMRSDLFGNVLTINEKNLDQTDQYDALARLYIKWENTSNGRDREYYGPNYPYTG